MNATHSVQFLKENSFVFVRLQFRMVFCICFRSHWIMSERVKKNSEKQNLYRNENEPTGME